VVEVLVEAKVLLVTSLEAANLLNQQLHQLQLHHQYQLKLYQQQAFLLRKRRQ
jgi:hypothetical protein